MSRSKTKIQVIKELCKGCGYCIEFCPRGVFERSKEINSRGATLPRRKKDAECIGCGFCVLLCPDFSLYMEDREKKQDE